MPTYNKDAYDISRAFGRIENELLGSMMRNMGRHRAEERDYGFDWPQWQALQLQELRRYWEENKEKFREDFDNINSQVESALRVAYESGQSDQEAVILDQIRRGKLEANRSFDADFFRLNNRRIDSLVEATTNDIKTAEQAILRMANDKYRQIVFDAQVYFASGAGTYEKAVDMAAHDMLMAGLNCIEYKNGARHTAADYAEMVIRTSGQRAYLRGEGQKRNEWGVHTVIVNKRGNPCPKCAPWCGKVMIDDVYAGATASEAKESGYPRVSTAMRAGFLHPRCKDTYTTWFPGVSQKPKPWTKEELASLDENARLEAEQKHAEKMAEKCGRVSRFSLDPEKQKIYEKRVEQWGEKAENLKSEELTQRRRQRLAERRRGEIQSAFDQMSAGQLRDYIDNNLVTEFTGLDGANTDFVREAVKVISTFEEMMGGKTIDGLSVQFGGTPKGVYAKYNDKTKTILLKKTGSIEKLEGSLKRENLRYRMRWKTDKDYHATETFSGQVWHELGHAVDVDTGQALSRSLSADSALDELSVKVSSYAGSTQNVRATKRSEAWAENFAAYMDGGRNKERVPKQIEEKIKGYFEQKAAGKAKNVAKAGKRKPKKAGVPDVKAEDTFIPAKRIEEARETKKKEVSLYKRTQNRKSDKEMYLRYRKVLGDDVPSRLEEFIDLKYNNKIKWGELKHRYRIINAYEYNSGYMSNDTIFDLDRIAFREKKHNFTGAAKRQANIAVMKIDGDEAFIGNSQVNNVSNPGFYNYKGDSSRIVLSQDIRQFKTLVVGTHDRWMDSEAKLFEYAATVCNDGKPHTIDLLSEKTMCKSCRYVMEQFKEKYPNCTVNAVSNKKERSLRNKNKPWRHRMHYDEGL